MKALLYLFLFVSTLPLPAKDENTDKILKDSATTMRLIWKEWLGKPKLEFTAVTKETLPSIYGEWSGAYIALDGDDDQKSTLEVIIKPNGTWASKQLKVDSKNGHWYLSEGMIFLFVAKISDDSEVFSALTLNSGKLRLIYANSKEGFVALGQKKEPEQK